MPYRKNPQKEGKRPRKTSCIDAPFAWRNHKTLHFRFFSFKIDCLFGEQVELPPALQEKTRTNISLKNRKKGIDMRRNPSYNADRLND